MRHDDLDFNLDDLDLSPQTLRVPPTIPPEAMPDSVPTVMSDAMPDVMPDVMSHAMTDVMSASMLVDEDTPTLVVVPSALAALAERSMETVPAAHPRRSRDRADEELALRRAVYGIWAVAAVLLATLGVLVK